MADIPARVYVATLPEMVARLILAALATGVLVSVGLALRENVSLFDWALTAASCAVGVLLSGALTGIRPVSAPPAGLEGVVDALRQAPIAAWILRDRAAQLTVAIGIGLIVASVDAWLQASMWPGGVTAQAQPILSLSLVLLPMWVAVDLLAPRRPAPWASRLFSALVELARVNPRPMPRLLRVVLVAIARTLATAIGRGVAVVVIGWVLSSWWLTLACSGALLLALVGGETLLGLWRLISEPRRSPAATGEEASSE